MPRIPDRHLQSVVFIYPSREAAERGDQVGGTGFVVTQPTGVGNSRIRYVVTNEHIVSGGGHWVRLNHLGGTYVKHVPPDEWEWAPDGDDFALATLALPDYVVPYAVALDIAAATREEAKALNVGPGDEAYMVGRFMAHGGRATNNPIARFGSVSLMPNPTELVRDGRGRDVEAYLVEMRSHVGFSGSPVFILIPRDTPRGNPGPVKDDAQTKYRLIGIDTGHKIDPLPVMEKTPEGKWEAAKGRRVEHYSDVAIVAPIWKVVDLLNREDLAEDRAQMGRHLEEMRDSADASSDAAAGQLDEVDEPADLTK